VPLPRRFLFGPVVATHVKPGLMGVGIWSARLWFRMVAQATVVQLLWRTAHLTLWWIVVARPARLLELTAAPMPVLVSGLEDRNPLVRLYALRDLARLADRPGAPLRQLLFNDLSAPYERADGCTQGATRAGG